jgi:hypothetical protein
MEAAGRGTEECSGIWSESAFKIMRKKQIEGRKITRLNIEKPV